MFIVDLSSLPFHNEMQNTLCVKKRNIYMLYYSQTVNMCPLCDSRQSWAKIPSGGFIMSVLYPYLQWWTSSSATQHHEVPSECAGT